MALIFIDGFDHVASADLVKKWGVTSTTAPSIGIGRRGGGAIQGSTTTRTCNKSFTAGSSFVVGMAVFVVAGLSNAPIVALFKDAGSSQCSLQLNLDGTISVMRAVTTVVATSGPAYTLGSWNYIEWKFTIADSITANSCKVRVNGAEVLNVATGTDIKQTTNASANSVDIGFQAAASGCLIDDFYLLDQSGSAPLNDFLGDCRIDTLYPSADGTYSDFTPSTGTTHYSLVDETTPNTTDYNSSSTVGQRDSYGFQDLTALTSQTVYGVQVNAAVTKDDAGARSLATFARSGTTNSDGANAALSTSQTYVAQVFSTDPSTGAAWTEAAVNAAQFGIVVTV